MAGGLGRGGVPLHARARVGEDGPAQPVKEAAAGPAKHCWVKAPVDAGRPTPGLLLEWRKDERGWWEGLVVYTAQLRPGCWVTVQEWVAADLLADVNDR
jgi:hypothetical protein